MFTKFKELSLKFKIHKSTWSFSWIVA